MRFVLSAALLALTATACSVPRAPGAPQTDVTVLNSENTGEWRVLEQKNEGGHAVVRVAAQFPQRAQLIAQKVIYQRLSEAPRQVVVEVVPMADEHAAPVAQVTWTRPTAPQSNVPAPLDSTAAGDRLGRSAVHPELK